MNDKEIFYFIFQLDANFYSLHPSNVRHRDLLLPQSLISHCFLIHINNLFSCEQQLMSHNNHTTVALSLVIITSLDVWM